MKKEHHHSVHSALSLMKNCPSCNSKYISSSVYVITTGEKGSLVSVMCDRCKLAVLILITAMPFGLVGTGLPTDCSPEEIKYYMDKEEITADDALEAHTLLGKH